MWYVIKIQLVDGVPVITNWTEEIDRSAADIRVKDWGRHNRENDNIEIIKVWLE